MITATAPHGRPLANLFFLDTGGGSMPEVLDNETVQWFAAAAAQLARSQVTANASAAAEKPLPSTVTGVPPSAAPRVGLTDETATAGR